MVWVVKIVVATIGIGLQDAGPARQMPDWMLLSPICREEVKRCGWCSASEGPIIAQIRSEPGGCGSALGQERHGRVVGVQSLGAENIGSDQVVDWLQRYGASPDLVGQC